MFADLYYITGYSGFLWFPSPTILTMILSVIQILFQLTVFFGMFPKFLWAGDGWQVLSEKQSQK